MHESRHKHALKRHRSSGGRFLSKAELEALETESGDTHGTAESSDVVDAAVSDRESGDPPAPGTPSAAVED